jgi:hypothetical protein
LTQEISALHDYHGATIGAVVAAGVSRTSKAGREPVWSGTDASEASATSCDQRLQTATEMVVKSLWYSEETKLTAPIVGTSKFTPDFDARGLKDGQGRSLREFDLKMRKFRYPCCGMRQTAAFEELPEELKTSFGLRIKALLSSESPEQGFEHLTAEERMTLLVILPETKPGLID